MSNYAEKDFWTLKAQTERFPARSVYKLREIVEKFRIINNDPAVPCKILELGAAPGSWSLYILRRAKTAALKNLSLTACDLSPLSRQFDDGLFDGGNFSFVQGDFTDAAFRKIIAERGPYDIILSDAAPATSGNRTLDTCRSAVLVEAALDYALHDMTAGGSFVVKIFQGSATADFLNTARKHFATAKTFKPKASRPNSFETYFVAQPAGVFVGRVIEKE
jgi:23S rRNA (uridine2552-2'-O)-methyltransferase